MSNDELKELVRRWFAENDRGNEAIVDELCAPDYLDHTPQVPGMPEDVQGVAPLKATLKALREAFTEVEHSVDDVIAEGDRVVARIRARGRFTGPIRNIPPNGKMVEITGISIHRVENGKLVEHWADLDMLSFLQQLGVLPPLPTATTPH
jgi:steroid delta-isomerase-like uncharacterized protein